MTSENWYRTSKHSGLITVISSAPRNLTKLTVKYKNTNKNKENRIGEGFRDEFMMSTFN